MSDPATEPNNVSQLADEVLRLARAHDNKALLSIRANPATEALLAEMSDRQSAQIRVHLNAAELWRQKQNRKAEEKLDAAAKSLDELDTVLAKGILNKIDSEILDPDTLERYDELLLGVTARAMEIEEIEQSLPPTPPGDDRKRRRFWRR